MGEALVSRTVPTLMNIRSWLKNKRIGVLYGGRSAERPISLLSGKAVLAALKELGVNAVGIDAGPDLAFDLKKNKIDFAYIALHGPWGEDGTVQGLLEIMGIPYSGCGVLSSALSMNKIYSKRIFDSAGIPTPRWTVLGPEGAKTLPRFPCFVKPSTQGSAIGVSRVTGKSSFKIAVKKAFEFDDRILVEKLISGTEITVGVLGRTALPVIEIVPANKFYDYESKYKPGFSRHLIPARTSGSASAGAQKLALAVFDALGCKAVARIDMIIDKKGNHWVLEANTVPGMTETSLLPDAARAAGLSFGDLILEIIRFSVNG